MSLPKIQMPIYADAPRQYLYWEEDQMFTFLTCLVAGIALEMTWTLFFTGFAATFLLQRIKSAHLPGYAQHFLFRLGAPLNKLYRNGLSRRFVA